MANDYGGGTLGAIRATTIDRAFPMADVFDYQMANDKPVRDQISQQWGVSNYLSNKQAAYSPLDSLARTEIDSQNMAPPIPLVETEQAQQMLSQGPRHNIKPATPMQMMAPVSNTTISELIMGGNNTGDTRKLQEKIDSQKMSSVGWLMRGK